MFLYKLIDILERTFQSDEDNQDKRVTYLRFAGNCDGRASTTANEAVRGKDRPEPAVLLITVGSGGTGLNLTAASQVIQCEP